MTKQNECPKQHINSCRYKKNVGIQRKCACKHINNSPYININDKIFKLEHIVNDLSGHRKVSEARIDYLEKELIKFKTLKPKKDCYQKVKLCIKRRVYYAQ